MTAPFRFGRPRRLPLAIASALACGALALSPARALALTPAYEPVPVRRLVNDLNGAHLITADPNEAATLDGKGGWKLEGIAFYAPNVETSTPVWRLLNPSNGDHLYTTDANEYETLERAGWTKEGIAFYGAESGTYPVRRLWNSEQTADGGLGSHLWTVDANEYEALPLATPEEAWKQEGGVWNAESVAGREPTFTHEGQTIPLDPENVDNARQLGGYVMADGRVVRDGMLLRSGDLSRISTEDQALLEDTYHLHQICDFRSAGSEGGPDIVPEGATLHELPAMDAMAIYDMDTLKAMGEARTEADPATATYLAMARHNGMSQLYSKLLNTDRAKEAYRGFFDALLENARSDDPGAVLWHCTQGKDRAGLASALVLSALGADDATIRRDHVMSSESYAAKPGYLEQYRELAETAGLDEHETQELMATVGDIGPAYMELAMESVKDEYGSLRGYLEQAIGLTEQDFADLQAAYLEPAS